MASGVGRSKLSRVRPIFSLDSGEARKRVLNLYRAWYKQIPYIVLEYDIPKSVEQCREKLRGEFEKNRNLTDLRLIDMLVIKGQQELQESAHKWKQECHFMAYWKDSHEPKPKDFLSKFINGSE